MKITILQRNEILGNSKLEIFEKRGSKAAISDYAICSGGYVSSDNYLGAEKLENRTGWYWTKTDDGGNDAHVVSYDEDDTIYYVKDRDGGVRPALPFSFISSICTNKVTAAGGILEVEYGEYPQRAASKELQIELERLFQRGSLSKTGKQYTRDSVKYAQYDRKFEEEQQEEYEYNGKKYVRVRVNSYYDGDEFKLSNGEGYQDDDYVWIEVEPIKWLVDERKNVAITEKILFAGIQFKNTRDYKGDFENTDLYWYLDTYFSKEMISKKEEQVSKVQDSVYQKSIEKLQKELIELINLMPNDLKIKIKDKYNQIIDQYNENLEKEKSSILTNSLSFGIKDSYDFLYISFLFLKEEICLNQNIILKLKQILDYREILSERVETKNNGVETIEKIIQNIKFKLQYIPTETSPYLKDYHDKIISKLEILFSKTEEEYQNQLKKAFGYQSLSHYSESNPMGKLKEKLEHLLVTMENSLLKECLEILYSFSAKSDNIKIRSLSDHIKTINYVVSTIPDNQQQSNWSYLKTTYQESYLEMISNWIDETIDPESKKELDTRFRNDLSTYISDIVEIQENNNYLLGKIEEVNHSYQLIFAPSLEVHEKKATISSLLMLEIISAGCFNVEFDIKKVILEKVDEITKRLKYAESRSDVDNIMQEYYKFLTDIWAQVKGLDNFEKRKVYIQKI